MSSIRIGVASQIKKYRRMAMPRLTQAQLAEKMGVETTTVWRWENGLSFPEPSSMESLARIFGISIHELMGGADNAPPSYDALLAALNEKQKENLQLKSENQRLSEILLKIPPEFFARLAVRPLSDPGARIAWAFLSGDISQLKEPQLQDQLKSALGKVGEKIE